MPKVRMELLFAAASAGPLAFECVSKWVAGRNVDLRSCVDEKAPTRDFVPNEEGAVQCAGRHGRY